ncbi:uncharacterized protein LOC113206923 [Frankliniella occidentalis]|uniref:Uncharacterized protein LOC113206923 n=1 Tax=Frankliniella occidentalis TaxID=133901 RepID=A0A6J1SKB8_FRAOC|nr:uncharacterized protein LOC113206923 [Frankliniella occidentalis]
MSACCLKLCVKSAKERRRIHRFPKDEQRRKEWEKWVSTVNQSPFSSKPSSRLCNKHFLKECYQENGLLKPDAVPTLIPECDLSNLFRMGFLPSTSSVSLSVLVGNNLVSNPEGQTSSQACHATQRDETWSNSATTVCVDKSSNPLLGPVPTSCITENPQVPLDLSTRSVNEHNTPRSGPKASSTLKTPAERVPNKRKRYPGDITPGDFSTPKRAKRARHCVEFLKDDRERLNRKIRRVRESCRRKQTKAKQSLTCVAVVAGVGTAQRPGCSPYFLHGGS